MPYEPMWHEKLTGIARATGFPVGLSYDPRQQVWVAKADRLWNSSDTIKAEAPTWSAALDELVKRVHRQANQDVYRAKRAQEEARERLENISGERR